MDQWNAVFHRHYDVAILGTGLSGCAAALALSARGLRVVLIGERGDIAWEWGRAFCPDAGDTEATGWGTLMDALRTVGGWRQTRAGARVEGSLGELVCYQQLRDAGVDLAWMLWPVSLSRHADGAIHAVTLACKSGLRRIAAARWIDASEAGTLLRLAGGPAPRIVSRRWHYRWQSPRTCDETVQTSDVACLGPGAVASEWDCAIRTGPEERPADMLDRWQELPEAWRQELSGLLFSHASTESLNTYEAPITLPTLAPNLVVAVPGVLAQQSDPAQRWAIGVEAAGISSQQAPAPAADGAAEIHETELAQVDVAVIGAGTGGAQAAIAAAENGARTCVVEPLSVPGGVGVNAGIHWYWWGVPGGLQQQIDQETHDWMCRLGIESDLRRLAWQPDVKGWVLDRRLARAGVQRWYGSLCYQVRHEGRRVRAVSIATPEGPRRIRASNWVDSSGDGDLCVMAGARFSAGRQGDGRYHACTQSARQLESTADQKPGEDDGLPRMKVVNFDSGWVDPEDPADWTRARCEGLNAYVDAMHEPEAQRHTSIAPALGIRQSRQIRTRQILSIDDVFARRDFPDAIGFAGCNVDNHSVDLAMEDDGFVFGRCILGHGGIGMPVVALPYGMVVPEDLDNVWIGCRAAGLDHHAHYPIRQMRDIQRLGEACGVAAALCADSRANHAVDLTTLQDRLRASGALARELMPAKPVLCGRSARSLKELGEKSVSDYVAEALSALVDGKPTLGLWFVAKDIETHAADLGTLLNDDNRDVQFIAAATLAFAGDSTGAPRLLQAWRERETGGGGLPHWYRALCLIRGCAGPTQLQELLDTLPQAPVLHDLVTALLLVTERVLHRHPEAREVALRLRDWARSVSVCGQHRPPQFSLVSLLDSWAAGEEIRAIPYKAGHARNLAMTRYVGEDWSWQRQVLCARLSRACNEDPSPDLVDLADDARRYVRRAACAVQAEPTAIEVLA